MENQTGKQPGFIFILKAFLPAQTFGILHESSSELNTLELQLQFFALWADSLSDLTTGRILGNSFENYLKKHSLSIFFNFIGTQLY
ncbi:uncharacterized protein OCT59_011532 [Rhizophagus irregularis]|uniref:uncharacterized protein n=1 Tax=Rhizophagus irregularis TaxID=588596 RepID=UPI0033271115|nr:hypothetical protein OCT59_011532 [Rhizophagus irregularis]